MNKGKNVHENILGAIGNTPLIKLNRIVEDFPCDVYAKVEYFNPGHSVKDRMALQMIEDAEVSGDLKPGGTIIECTSGNTGMGLALICIKKGYKLICTMSDKQSKEKVDILKALGAENGLIRKIFNYTGIRIVAKGLLLGNSIALGLCALQYYFKIIPLDPKDYYMSYVPISWDWDIIILLNLLTFVVVTIILAIPTIFITRIQPIKAIRFD